MVNTVNTFFSKNDFIIQIMTESYEIDDLRRKVEDSKMKLETEQKVCDIFLQYMLLKQQQLNTLQPINHLQTF